MRKVTSGSSERPCPYCGKVIVVDNKQRAFHHAVPICARWRALMLENGGKESVTIQVK
jgi:hypothetical protein